MEKRIELEMRGRSPAEVSQDLAPALFKATNRKSRPLVCGMLISKGVMGLIFSLPVQRAKLCNQRT